jgi:hypothetical protein
MTKRPNVKRLTACHVDAKTSVAHAGYDEHFYAGYRVFEQLVGNESLCGLIVLGVTGRRLAADEAAVLDDVAAIFTLADARLWPMKIPRLVASYGGSLEGIAAGYLGLHCAHLGMWGGLQSAAYLLRELEELSRDRPFSQAVEMLLGRHKLVAGFGTPFREYDERLAPFERAIKRRGRHELPAYTLFFRLVEQMALKRPAVKPNIGGAAAAVMLDLGIEPEQIGPIGCALGTHMYLAHAFEGATRREPSLACLPVENVDYRGPARRKSPRAVEH